MTTRCAIAVSPDLDELRKVDDEFRFSAVAELSDLLHQLVGEIPGANQERGIFRNIPGVLQRLDWMRCTGDRQSDLERSLIEIDIGNDARSADEGQRLCRDTHEC